MLLQLFKFGHQSTHSTIHVFDIGEVLRLIFVPGNLTILGN